MGGLTEKSGVAVLWMLLLHNGAMQEPISGKFRDFSVLWS